MKFDLAWVFLSFRGRVSRQEFWLGNSGITVVLVLLVRPLLSFWLRLQSDTAQPSDLDELGLASWLLVFITLLVALWPIGALYAKRLHDLNLAGWWQLLVPAIGWIEVNGRFDRSGLIGMALVAMLGLLPGTRGINRFGNDPRPPQRPA